MTITREMIQSIENNLDTKITVFNYDKVVRKTVVDFKKLIQIFDPKTQVEKLEGLSKILYLELYDIYPTVLRDESCWNKYFDKVLNETRVITEIDRETAKITEKGVKQNAP